MADKKMTDLTDLSTGVASDDILHVVDDPSGSPVNKKVSVFNLMGNLNHTTNTGDVTGRSLVKSTIDVNRSTTSGDIVALESVTTHTKGASGTGNSVVNIFGAKVHANVAGASSVVTGTAAGAKITFDLTSGVLADNVNTAFTGGTARVYGLQINMTDSQSTRAVKPDAFICLNDDAANDDTEELYQMSHLIEMGSGTDYVKATANGQAFANGHGIMGTSVNAHTFHTDSNSFDSKIRIKVNGTEYFLLATSNGFFGTGVA